MNEEMVMMEETENTEVAVLDEPETSGRNGGAGKTALILAAAVAGTAFLLHKTRDKREQRKIEKLRKKGYVIYAPGELDDIETSCTDDEE